MSFLRTFAHSLDLSALISLVSQVVAALICIIFHECAHGFAADRLGDHTARQRGRLSWNPLRHIDPFGLVMMVVAGVGWAKPVPVNPGNFRHPKRGMAITALAGPVANFVMAFAATFLLSLLYHSPLNLWAQPVNFIFILLYRIAILSVGLGVFNLIPIPPLDGSKVLFSFFPDRIYFSILRYERYIMLALFALIFVGALDRPLNYGIRYMMRLICLLTGMPPTALGL